MPAFKPVVGDHALLRWLEREHGLDVEGLRRLLLEEARPYLEAGAVSFPIGKSGCYGSAARGALITVLPCRPSSMRTGRHFNKNVGGV